MSDSQGLFGQMDIWFNEAGAGNEPWRFFAALAVLVIGFIILEIFFRSGSRRLRTSFEKKEISESFQYVAILMPPLRLAGIAFLMRMAESLLTIPFQLVQLLHGLEGLLLALAAILFLFQAIGLLDRLTSALPDRLQEGFPEPTISKLKSALRVSVLIMVAAAFVYTQRTLFPEWLWKYAWWRYLLVIVIINLVFLLIRLTERFLSGLLLDLKESEERHYWLDFAILEVGSSRLLN